MLFDFHGYEYLTNKTLIRDTVFYSSIPYKWSLHHSPWSGIVAAGQDSQTSTPTSYSQCCLLPRETNHTAWAMALLTRARSTPLKMDLRDGRGRPHLLDAGRANVVCQEHGSKQCYCIWMFYKDDRVYTDWKPYTLGKYEAMVRGEECEIHKLFKCCCLTFWPSSKKDDIRTHNNKYPTRRDRKPYRYGIKVIFVFF